MLRRIWRSATLRLTALKGGATVCPVRERPATNRKGVVSRSAASQARQELRDESPG